MKMRRVVPEARETDEWLRRVFTTPERKELTAAYDAWAVRYEADMLAVGYMHPFVAAGLVGRHVRDRLTPILDAGTGSGLLGQVLAIITSVMRRRPYSTSSFASRGRAGT
jgi:predicted TPR repeat methyltransferase